MDELKELFGDYKDSEGMWRKQLEIYRNILYIYRRKMLRFKKLKKLYIKCDTGCYEMIVICCIIASDY